MEPKDAPVGAAVFMMEEETLALMLNLPEGVHVQRVYVPHAIYGRSIGFVLWTDKEGLLPPTPEPGQELRDISQYILGEGFQLSEGKVYFRVLFQPPEKGW